MNLTIPGGHACDNPEHSGGKGTLFDAHVPPPQKNSSQLIDPTAITRVSIWRDHQEQYDRYQRTAGLPTRMSVACSESIAIKT